MTREERAKQFAPFDAMKGLQEALREREEIYSRVERHDISEEQMLENSEVFIKLTKGATVKMECYRAFHDVEITGTVTKIDTVFRYLIVAGEKFRFSDIYRIKIINGAVKKVP